MGTSIADLKARLQGLNRRTLVNGDIWKPKDEHDIRLIPYPHGADPLLPRFFHSEVNGQDPILCPLQNFGEDCDICTLADSLRAWKDDNGVDKPESVRKRDFEVFKKIQAKARVFVPMIERGKESEGPKFWGMTTAQADIVLGEACDADRMAECGLDPEEKDADKILQVLINPKKAYDIHVSFAKPGEKGNTKTFIQITPKARIKASKLGDEKLISSILGAVKKIEDVHTKISSEEVARLLKKFVNSDGPEAKAEGGSEKYATNSKEDVKKVGTKSVEEAFGEMAN